MNFNFKGLINKEFVRNVLTLVSASTLSQAIAFLVYFILIRIYTPAEHGLLALYLSIISVTGIIATAKYDLAIMMPGSRTQAGALTLLTLLIGMGFSLILLLVTLFFSEFLASFLGNENLESWLYLVPLSTFLTSSSQAIQTWSNRRKKYRIIAGANLSQSLVNSTVKLASVNMFNSGGGLVAGAIAGQVAGNAVFIRSILVKDIPVFKAIKWKEIRSVAKKYHLFPRFNLIHYVINNFSTSLPIFLFSSAFSATEVGLYSLGMMMINRPLNILTSSFTQVLSQRVISNYNKNLKVTTEIKKLVFRLFFLAIIPFILAGILAPLGFRIIGGDEWTQAGVYMRYLLPWLFLVFLSSPLSFIPDMLKRQQKAMWIDIAKFVLRLMALLIGIRLNSIDLSILLFSGVSGLLVAYNLYWYIHLSVSADNQFKESNTS